MALDCAQIRHRNFLHLFNQFIHKNADLPMRGMAKRFALHLGWSERFFGHIKCSRKNIGAQLARAIEKRFGLPYGWMDCDHPPYAPPCDEREHLFVGAALALFRASPDRAREFLLNSLNEQLSFNSLAAPCDLGN